MGKGNNKSKAPVTTGTDGNDTLSGDNTENKINGGDGNDIIIGAEGADRVNAGDGDDIITGGAGDDTIFGNDGNDTAVFSGDVRNYTFTEGKGNSLIVSGDDGTDTLKHIENLQFDNFTVNLDGSNNGPLVEDAALTVSEDGSGSVDLLAGAWDFEGDTISVVGGDQIFNFDAAGSYDYLAVGETATATHTFTATDGTDTATGAVSITITGVNDVPMAGADAASAVEDEGPTTGNVLVNDIDVDTGDRLLVTSVGDQTLASGATVSLAEDGSYTYNQNGVFDALNDGETATDTFSYTVSDSNGGTDTASVTVTITGVTDSSGGGGRSGLSTDYLDLGLGEPVDNNRAYWQAGIHMNEDGVWLEDVVYLYASTFYGTQEDDVYQFRGDAGNSFYASRFYMWEGDNTVALATSGGHYIARMYVDGKSGDDTVMMQSNGSAIFNNPLWLGGGDNYISLQVNDAPDGVATVTNTARISNNLLDAVGGANTFIIQSNASFADNAQIYRNTFRDRGPDGDNVFIIEQNATGALNADVWGNSMSAGDGNDILTIIGADDDLNGSASVHHNGLNGGSGDDIITIHSTAGGGNSLVGGAGNDTLHSGAGRDNLHGQSGDDVFIFDDDSGSDYVRDFEDGSDMLDVSGVSGVSDASDLSISNIGNWYYVDLGNGDTLSVYSTGGAVDATDFIFA